jgi:hypothetical protein
MALAVATALVAPAACSSKSSPGSGSADGGGEAAAPEAGPVEASPDVSVLVIDTGFVCPLEPQTGAGAGCDTCIERSCDTPWCQCAEDMDDEAGIAGCLGYVGCASSCVADGGDASACETTGCAVAPSTAADQQKGQALFACIQKSCATDCPGFVAPFL